MGHARVTPNRLLCHLERVLERGRTFETEAVHDVAITADDDDVAGVVHRVRRPVPRVERVSSVVRMGLAV